VVDIQGFYAVVAVTCFALAGLWWNVVNGKPQWRERPELRRLSAGVYQSFLIPGLMSFGAQLAGTQTAIWRSVFVIAALAGGACTVQLIRVTPVSGRGMFGRHRWVVVVLYAVIAVVGVFPELAREIELEPLQAEGILVSLLMLAGHALAWEFMYGPEVTERAPADRDPGGELAPPTLQ
jgi:hypothetical protein